VPDSIAAFTARRFYENLVSLGAVRALRAARQSLLQVRAGDYWASFRIQGWS